MTDSDTVAAANERRSMQCMALQCVLASDSMRARGDATLLRSLVSAGEIEQAILAARRAVRQQQQQQQQQQRQVPYMHAPDGVPAGPAALLQAPAPVRAADRKRLPAATPALGAMSLTVEPARSELSVGGGSAAAVVDDDSDAARAKRRAIAYLPPMPSETHPLYSYLFPTQSQSASASASAKRPASRRVAGTGDASLASARDSWTSPFSGRRLCAFIFRDEAFRAPAFDVLCELSERACALPANADGGATASPVRSLDYTYLRPQHVWQVQELLANAFWEGIDVSEFLDTPEYTVVALAGRRVMGCVLMSPNGYIPFLCVDPRVQRHGIATKLLFLALQTLPTTDVTLHVSVDSPATLLYARFGFKCEQFIANYYAGFYDPRARSLHALFLRFVRQQRRV